MKKVTLKITLSFPCTAGERPDTDHIVEKVEDFLQCSFSPGIPMEWPEVDLISPIDVRGDGNDTERHAVILTDSEVEFLADFLSRDTQDDQDDRDGVNSVMDALARAKGFMQ